VRCGQAEALELGWAGQGRIEPKWAKQEWSSLSPSPSGRDADADGRVTHLQMRKLTRSESINSLTTMVWRRADVGVPRLGQPKTDVEDKNEV
jgi:hypothetical protein